MDSRKLTQTSLLTRRDALDATPDPSTNDGFRGGCHAIFGPALHPIGSFYSILVLHI